MCCYLLTTAIVVLFASFAVAFDWTATDAGSRDVAKVEFALPCDGCLTGQPADEALVFDFALLGPASDGIGQYALNAKLEQFRTDCDSESQPSPHCESQSLTKTVALLNNTQPDVAASEAVPTLLASYTFDARIDHEASGEADNPQPRQHLSFQFNSIDDNRLDRNVGFTVVATFDPKPRILDIISQDSPIDNSLLYGVDASDMGKPEQDPERKPLLDFTDPGQPDFNVDIAIDQLRFLEQQLAVQRNRIGQHLRKEPSNAQLKHLLRMRPGSGAQE